VGDNEYPYDYGDGWSDEKDKKSVTDSLDKLQTPQQNTPE